MALAAALTIAGLAVAPKVSAQAGTAPATGTPATVSADALPTVQIDGVAWDQVVVGNTVYVTGKFTNARPAGSAAGVNNTARGNLLAYDITTGNLISTFNYPLNAQGRSIFASPDGTRLYVVGDFTTVGGVTHNHIAAFNLSAGGATATLDNTFTASVNTNAFAVTATNTTVYVGGYFSSVNGSARSRLAALNRSGALLAWNPGADNTVWSLVMAPDQSRVVAGGSFTTLAGAARVGIGSVMAADASAGPWPADFPIKDYGSSAAINSLVADGTTVYGSAYQFTTGGNFEGRFAVNPYTGQLVWMNSCHGDSYDTAVIGPVLYSASHEHDCSDIRWFNQDDPGATTSTHHFLAAEATSPSGTALHPIFTGGPGQPGPRYADFSGQPTAPQLYWYPTTNTGSFTGQYQSAWTVAGNATYLAIGGEFTTANGTAQQGLTRFAVRGTAPNRRGPQNVTAPTAVSQSSGALKVTWRAAWDQDNQGLMYALLRDGAATPIFTTSYQGGFFDRPSLGYVDTALAAGSSHTYQVRVTDPTGNTVTSPASAAATVGSASVPSYTAMVRADGASSLWRFSEASGSTAYDSVGPTHLTLRSAVSLGAPGPIPGQGTAATFPGTFTTTTTGTPPRTTTTVTSDSVAASAGDVTAPTTYTLEAWVKTSDTTGGVVLSDSLYAPDNGRESATLDRVLYLGDDGKINFGVFDEGGVKTTIASPNAYNDGAWHHLAATSGTGGAAVFVDGSKVASDASLTDDGVFWGHWRVGGDSLTRWTPLPTDGYLAGSVADVAVYPSVLSDAKIQAHYAAGSGGPVNADPTAAFTSTCTNLSCSFDAGGSSDDGSIASYAWDFGDGSTGGGVRPNHSYAAAGTYSVKLTVTDNLGATGTTVRSVTVAAAPADDTFAADAFGRNVSGGLGSADLGGAWTVSPATRFAVNGSAATVSLVAGSTDTGYLGAASATSTDLTLTTSIDKLPSSGSAYLDVTGRRAGTNEEYDALVRIQNTGVVTLGLRKLNGSATATDIVAGRTVSGLTYTAGTPLKVRLQVSGTSPTTLQAKVWRADAAEPGTWQVTATDSSAGLQTAGSVGIRSYLGSGATNGPLVQTLDDLSAKPVA